jgi:SpoIID/LytB domain protein
MADPYLLCSTQHCQVYAGAGQEHPRTTEAVNATRGMVLLRKDGRLVDTVYSASCGGFTEHNDNTWPVKADDTLRGHLDADPDNPFLQAFRKGINEKNFMSWLNAPLKTWCGQTRLNQNKYRWKEVIPAAKMDELVKPFGIGHLRGIRIIKRGISGRVNSLELQGTQGKRQIRGELDIRQLFGGLKSSMFMVEIRPGSHGRPQEFIFRGGGWGHGVGMCQTGAIGMAEAGKKYQTILRHYYPHSEIKALY